MATAESRFGNGFRADLGRRRAFVELGADGWIVKIYNLDQHQFELIKKVDNPELGQKKPAAKHCVCHTSIGIHTDRPLPTPDPQSFP